MLGPIYHLQEYDFKSCYIISDVYLKIDCILALNLLGTLYLH